MKLLFCLKCQDVIKLQLEERTCKCGETHGHYENDELHAVFGGPCKMIGFDNMTLRQALMTPERKDGFGVRFEAFIIPESAGTVKRIE